MNSDSTVNENIDWGTVSTEGPPPLTPGIYQGKIIEAEATDTGNGKPCVKVVWEATTSYDGSKATGFRKCYLTITCIPETMFRVLQLARAIEVDPPANFGFEARDEFAQALLSRECYARVKNRKYEGRDRNDLDRFLTSTEAGEQAGVVAEAEVTQMPRRGRRAQAAAE